MEGKIDFSEEIKNELNLFDNYLKYRQSKNLEIGNMDWVIFDSSETMYKNIVTKIRKIAKNYNVNVIAGICGSEEFTRNKFGILYPYSCVTVLGHKYEKDTCNTYCDNAMFSLDLNKFTENSTENYINTTVAKYGLRFAENTNLNGLTKLAGKKLENKLTKIIVKTLAKGTKIITNETIQQIENISSFPLTNFDSLIGLDEVKKTLNEVINYLNISKFRNNDIPSLHMAFLGNPGTGKTTVAQMLGNILAENKLLSLNPPFVEVGRENLVGTHIGDTESIVLEKIEEAKGGILFIDEAYSLSYSDSRRDFGYEVINVLVKQLDIHKNDLCVIFAGYIDEMLDFLKTNPGLSSRVPFKIKFSDYSSEELLEIFNKFIKNDKLKIQEGYEILLLEHFKKIVGKKNSGNGRYVRNLYERIKIIQANRIIDKKTNKKANFIKLADIRKAINSMREIVPEKTCIGF